jgi:hypothetical protein
MIQFDTRKVFKQLQNAGLKDNVADAIVSAINESRIADLDNLATKQDLLKIESDIKVINVRLDHIEKNVTEGFDHVAKEFEKIYRLGKFILAIIFIPIGIKLIEVFLPKFFP